MDRVGSTLCGSTLGSHVFHARWSPLSASRHDPPRCFTGPSDLGPPLTKLVLVPSKHLSHNSSGVHLRFPVRRAGGWFDSHVLHRLYCAFHRSPIASASTLYAFRHFWSQTLVPCIRASGDLLVGATIPLLVVGCLVNPTLWKITDLWPLPPSFLGASCLRTYTYSGPTDVESLAVWFRVNPPPAALQSHFSTELARTQPHTWVSRSNVCLMAEQWRMFDPTKRTSTTCQACLTRLASSEVSL